MRWTGRLLVGASIGLWLTWLGWRLTTMNGVVGAFVFVLEVVALSAAVVLSASLWNAPHGVATGAQRRAARRGDGPLPETLAVAVGLDAADSSPADRVGSDDTGEVAWARRGVRVLNPWSTSARPTLAQAGWSVVAVEGIRRMAFVVVLGLVLLTGRFPFDVPRWEWLALLAVSQLLLACGHYLLSDGLLLPGARLRWSMASVGAGLGDGTSRTGLPIRWTSTLATMVALNVVVSLRGLSDRWTHGLGVMAHDERVVAMLAAAWFVAWGFVALRSLPRPELGYYGATRRLEETSARRLALGATLAVAAIGLVAGVLPGGAPA